MPVRETGAMIAGMSPRLVDGEVAFACVDAISALPDEVRATVHEAEGVTLVLPVGHPLVPSDAAAMRQITLDVQSALDGVGLTAAVSEALASAHIPCNVIAGFHHDHIFVPAGMADDALSVLKDCAKGE